jgi:adenylate cyclase
MTDILLSHYGTLDKYEGDAIIAFFGAPAVLPNHAARACHTAIDMQQTLEKLRKKWCSEKCDRRCAERESRCGDKCGQKDKWPEIVHNMRMRIGINTGAITTGNMGSAVRMNYTMMGDAVNLAARLESAAKQYGVSTMISEFTYNEIKEFEVRKLGRIKVVGKSEAVTVYELIGRKGELSAETENLLETYNRGIGHYYNREWKDALECFTEANELEPNTKTAPQKITPSKRFIASCNEYLKNPPGDDWDGVDELKSK